MSDVFVPTAKQLELLQFLIRFIEEHGYQPSRAEMARHFGVSKNAITNRLLELERKGYLEVTAGKERAIVLHFLKFRGEIIEDVTV